MARVVETIGLGREELSVGGRHHSLRLRSCFESSRIKDSRSAQTQNRPICFFVLNVHNVECYRPMLFVAVWIHVVLLKSCRFERSLGPVHTFHSFSAATES